MRTKSAPASPKQPTQPKNHPARWWVPGEAAAIGIDGMFSAIARFDAEIADDARRTVADLGAEAPAWLTEDERQGAARLIELALRSYPASTPAQLLWMFAAEAFRPRNKGRKPKWSGLDGANLVSLVHAGLAAMGLERGARKGQRQREPAGLRVVIAELRARLPEFYGKYSEERLRQAYYEARDSFASKSGKSVN